MRKLFLLVVVLLMGVLLTACGTNPKTIEHQAKAKEAAAKWQARVDIQKWKAVEALAKSGSDVGRSGAAMAVQADAIQSGSRGAVSAAAGDYTQDPNALDYAIGISREARGWAGLKFGRDVALDNNKTQREIRFNDNQTYLGFGREIGDTGRTGIGATGALGAAAIQKIPSHAPAAQPAPEPPPAE